MSSHAPTTPRKSRDEQTLHDYLNDYSPEMPNLADSVKPGPNTRNADAYSFDDIANRVPTWRGFNYQDMRQRYNKILDRVVVAESAATSPQKGFEEKEFTSELSIQLFAARTVILQVNRAFAAIAPTPVSGGHPSPEMVDRLGEPSSYADRVGIHQASKQIRAVGEMKVSRKWSWSLHTAPTKTGRNTEFRQVLSQVHHYMNVHGTRYGYILTDREFVAIQRGGKKFGDIRVSEPVLWGGNGAGEMSLALAMWFLHKLATEDTAWHAPTFERTGGWKLRPDSVVGEGEGAGKAPALRKSKRLAERAPTLQGSDGREPAVLVQEERPDSVVGEGEGAGKAPALRKSKRLAEQGSVK